MPRAVVIASTVAALSWAPGGLRAQQPCPRASGPDAEAGWAAFGEGDTELARIHFDAALARCPDDDYARTGLAYVLLREGSLDEAADQWSAVLSRDPNNVDALTGLGLAAWRAGDVDEVRARFERVLALVPDHPTALDYMARVTRGGGGDPSDEAARAWADGDTQRARSLYAERLARDPDDEVAMLRVALVDAWSGRYDDALELLDRLLTASPGDLDARLARARVLAWSGRVDRAEREAEQILAVQPDNAEALEALALFQIWGGDLEASLNSYDALLSISPRGEAGRQRAQALAWGSRFDASLAAYRALLEREPGDTEARLGLARTLGYSQRFDEAVAEYDRVLGDSPSESRALTGKARTLGWAGRFVDAEAAAVRAVDANREDPSAWLVLGQIYRWEGRDPDAKEALEVAAGLAPTNADVLDQLRAVDLALAPVARTSLVREGDSDRNRMLTATLSVGVHVVPRLEVEARAFGRALDQGIFERSARGASLTARYQLRPGWNVVAGVGAARTNGTGSPTLAEGEVGVRSPDRHPFGGGVRWSSRALHETASLAELGGRSSEVTFSGRWSPPGAWRVDGTLGVGKIAGSEDNGRRSAALAASRRLGGRFAVGASARGFSFEKDLDDGYFDPDFYGIVELTSYWLYRPGRWTVLLEAAPGVQQVRSDGDPGLTARANARIGYTFGTGRDVSLSYGYSTAGLVSFATAAEDYSYSALILEASWTYGGRISSGRRPPL